MTKCFELYNFSSKFLISLTHFFQSDQFQEDLYPDTMGTTPAISAKDWISGINRPPVLISLKTGIPILTPKLKPRQFKPTSSFQVAVSRRTSLGSTSQIRT